MALPIRSPLGTALLLILVAACRPAARDPVILSLGEEVVRRSDFERHLKSLEDRGGAALAPEVQEAVLLPWLEERVQVLAARQKGLLKPGAAAEDERRAILVLLLDCSKVTVDDAEVEAYYREHPEEFQVPETVGLSQIIVGTSNEARDVRRRLAKDRKAFEAIAREVSRAPEAEAGGFMGTFSRGQLPTELEEVAFRLPVGGLSEVVVTSLGFHVLRVDTRQPAREVPLEETAGRIRARLEQQKAEKNVRQFVSDLMAQAKVNHAAAIASSRTSS